MEEAVVLFMVEVDGDAERPLQALQQVQVAERVEPDLPQVGVVAPEVRLADPASRGHVDQALNPLLHGRPVVIVHPAVPFFTILHDPALALSCSRSTAIRGLPIPVRGISATKLMRPGTL